MNGESSAMRDRPSDAARHCGRSRTAASGSTTGPTCAASAGALIADIAQQKVVEGRLHDHAAVRRRRADRDEKTIARRRAREAASLGERSGGSRYLDEAANPTPILNTIHSGNGRLRSGAGDAPGSPPVTACRGLHGTPRRRWSSGMPRRPEPATTWSRNECASHDGGARSRHADETKITRPSTPR